MAKPIIDYKVFIASPGGLENERKAFRDIVNELNELDIQARKVIFTPVGWEATLGGYERPQGLINRDLIECDYFILVLYDRWGSPPDTTENFSSGCEEEFDLAINCLEDPQKPMSEVVVFFKDVSRDKIEDPGPQLTKVLKFRNELEKSKKHLYMTFSELDSFRLYLRKFLTRWIRKTEGPTSEHLDILKKGVDFWNQWRQQFPDEIPNLDGADLSGYRLGNANLSSAKLSRANLNECDLVGANLSNANLTGANLKNANLHKANLTGSILKDAVIISTYIDSADFSESIFDRTTCVNLDLSSANGLDEVIHQEPSRISVDTLTISCGKIPKSFLMGCDLQDNFIAYIPSLFANSAIEFYSCFISYSHADKAFARRLYDALQGRGIRCWLDEHQLLPGDNIYDRIDQGIRVWDKILFCASRHSLISGWVDSELKHVFAKEKQLFKDNGSEILSLIPLNLDGYIFSGWNHPKKNQILERMAADFTGWESDNEKFEQQFERVVKALHVNNTGREPEPPPKL